MGSSSSKSEPIDVQRRGDRVYIKCTADQNEAVRKVLDEAKPGTWDHHEGNFHFVWSSSGSGDLFRSAVAALSAARFEVTSIDHVAGNS